MSSLPHLILALLLVLALPLAGVLFGYGLAWGGDLYRAQRRSVIRRLRDAEGAIPSEVPESRGPTS
jgi:hypothetical protein